MPSAQAAAPSGPDPDVPPFTGRLVGLLWLSLRRAWLLLRLLRLVRGRRVRIVRRPAPRAAGHPGHTIGLTLKDDEVAAIAEELELPPIITMAEAAKVARCAVNTLKRRVSEGDFKRSVKRGKPVLFHRDRFIEDVLRDR